MDNASSTAPTETAPSIFTTVAYESYVNWVDSALICVFCAVGIFYTGRLLFYGMRGSKSLKVKSFSPSMVLYLAVHLVGCITTLPYHLYIVVGWSAIPNYNQVAIYWLSQPLFLYFGIVPLPISILTLERSLILVRRGALFTRSRQWKNFILGCAALTGVTTFLIVLTLGDFPLAEHLQPGCQYFTCIINDYHSSVEFNVRNVLEVVDVVLALHFLYLYHTVRTAPGPAGQDNNNQRAANVDRALKNRLVKAVLIIELLFNVVPMNIAFFATELFNFSVVTYVGPYPMVFLAANVSLCGYFYTWMLLERKRSANTGGSAIGQQIVTVAPASSPRRVEIEMAG